MNRRQSLFALFAVAPVAAGAPAEAAGGGASASPDTQVDRRIMEINSVVFPVVRERRLVNYLFTSARIELTERGDQPAIRERSHFLRDSFVRATHRVDLSVPSDPLKLDRAAAVRVLMAAAEEALGPGCVRAIELAPESVLRYG